MKHSHENSVRSSFRLARASHLIIAVALFALTAGADKCGGGGGGGAGGPPPGAAVSITIAAPSTGSGIYCSGNFYVAADITNDLPERQTVDFAFGALNNVNQNPTIEMPDGSNSFGPQETKRVRIVGQLTNTCADGDFTLTGTGRKGGTGNQAFTVEAPAVTGTVPDGVTPDATGKFAYGNGTNDAIALQCCAGAQRNVTFEDHGGSNVAPLTITPSQQVCNGGAAFVQPKVESRLTDLYQPGIADIIVRSPNATSCSLVTNIEPAQ